MRVLVFTWLSLFFMGLYAVSVGAAIFQPGYSLLDRVFSAFLLFGLLFISIHGLGYANSMIKASWGYRETKKRVFSAAHGPKVTCIIASYNEPPEVLEETVALVLALDYSNKHVVLLDDSTKEEARRGALEIAERFGIEIRQRTTRRGYKAGAINDYLKECDSEYLAIFDADALPAHNFLADLMPMIAENPRLAFLQTPQFYANTEVSNVALAAARQQNVFYEYICEGKSYSRAMFCCGTNVIFRTKALLEVGGFDETNVTEDFASSFAMHLKGWDSLYLNRVYVYSLAPENLAAYFTQQSRWAFGTTTSARVFLKNFLQKPAALRAGQWWEYFLSATYYWIGPVNFLFMLLPLAYIFFGIKPLRQDTGSYAAVFLPYFLFTMNMFYVGMDARGYKAREMILGQQIAFITFPVHISSAISGLLGRKRPFMSTPKGVGGKLAWTALWPQFLLLILSAAAFLWGTYRYAAGLDRNTTAILVNSCWALYHVWMLGSVFKLNQPVREATGKAFFDDPERETTALRGPWPQAASRPLLQFGLALSLATLAFVGVCGVSVARWYAAPLVPVNLTIVDRTVGRDEIEHRSLIWALNYLKIRKQPGFGPNGGLKRTAYDSKLDYYGFVPGSGLKLRPDRTGQGDLVAFGRERALPATLATPGALYLADTYGEFVEYDARRDRYVRHRAKPRGLSAQEIDRIGNFARKGGLVMGEWNTLGFPTRPGVFASQAAVETAMRVMQERRDFLIWHEYVRVRHQLQAAERRGDFRAVGRLRGLVEDIRGQIVDAKAKLNGVKAYAKQRTIVAAQVAAHERLERLLHVRYAGWYGRYVERFEDEKEYDFPLYKNVRDYLTRQNNGRETLPSGPGFVFYPDGPSQIFDPKTRSLQPNPFAHPIAILGRDLGGGLPGEIALIHKSRKPGFADDALLRGVSATVPARAWFEVVNPMPGSRVLAYYKLKIQPAAAARLQNAGFPASYFSKDRRQIVFPSLVAWRDGGQKNGELRSLYFAGDAAGFSSVSGVAERFPAAGGMASALSGRLGSFSEQFFWGYYEPVLHNALTQTPRLRYQ